MPRIQTKCSLIHFDRQVELLEDFTTSREKMHHELDDMSATRQKRDDTQGPETTGDERERPQIVVVERNCTMRSFLHRTN